MFDIDYQLELELEQDEELLENQINNNLDFTDIPHFRREFREYYHHETTILKCSKVLRRIENTYRHAVLSRWKNQIHREKNCIQACKIVYKRARQLVDLVRLFERKPANFDHEKLFRELRDLQHILYNFQRYAENIYRANTEGTGSFDAPIK